MERKFFDVFGKLKDDSKGGFVLENCSIERLSTDRDETVLRVFLKSDTIIPKRAIWKLEDRIRDQYFGSNGTKVKIYESFNLPDTYSAEDLYNSYRDSILEEFYRNSPLLFQILEKSHFHFEDGKLTVTLEDTFLARNNEKEIVRILDKIFCERLGAKIVIDTEFVPPVGHPEQDELKEQAIQKQIDEIWDKAENSSKEDPKETGDKNQGDLPAENPYDRPSDDKSAINGEKPAFEKKAYLTKSKNPDTIYGRDFDDSCIDIRDVSDEMGEVVIHGQVRTTEDRELKNGKILFIITLTDFTDTIRAKLFLSKEQADLIREKITAGSFIKIKGDAKDDSFDHEISISRIRGIMKISDFRVKRMDNAVEKRVELHCHTKMSDMDGVSDVSDIIKQAISWGHKAIAITDHGVVQAF
ncbi:MAG: PolC-type DNA polymerase III N-terminal domain-containing protein, partial [Candidatus Weimeria sp.]